MTRRISFFVACYFVITTGCGGAPKPPPPTIVQASFNVAANVNPDAKGRASPVVVRFFELKSPATFQTADFFSLFEKERETLGADLVAREEMLLVPGDTKTLEQKLQPETRYVAVIAAFRDLERAAWRASTEVPLNKTTPVEIRLESNTVTIGASKK